MKTITKRQRDLLLILYDYIKSTGYPPTFEEMRESLGVSSNQSVVDLLNKLGEKSMALVFKSRLNGLIRKF